jgi:hypothetical protein
VSVDVSDLAGSGLEDDGGNNLRIAAAAAGDGLIGGAGSALAVGAGTGITVNANDVQLSPLTAETFFGNFTAGTAVGSARSGSAVAGAGLTYTAGGTLAVGDGAHIVVNANDVDVDLGAAYAWTGAHSFVSTAFDVDVSGQVFIDGATGARVSSSGSIVTIEGLGVIVSATSAAGDIDMVAGRDLEVGVGRDIILEADEQINITSNGDTTDRINLTAATGRIDLTAIETRLDSSGSAGGFLSVKESSASTPSVPAGYGQYSVANTAPSTPRFTDDTNVDHSILNQRLNRQDFTTSGTSNNVTLNVDTTYLRVDTGGSDWNITGFTGGYDGRILHVTTNSNVDGGFTHTSGSTSANQISVPSADGVSLSAGATRICRRYGATLIYDGDDSLWRVVSDNFRT